MSFTFCKLFRIRIYITLFVAPALSGTAQSPPFFSCTVPSTALFCPRKRRVKLCAVRISAEFSESWALSVTALIQAEHCLLLCWYKLSTVRYCADTSWAVSVTALIQAEQCLFLCWYVEHCPLLRWYKLSTVSVTALMQAEQCLLLCWYKLSTVRYCANTSWAVSKSALSHWDSAK